MPELMERPHTFSKVNGITFLFVFLFASFCGLFLLFPFFTLLKCVVIGLLGGDVTFPPYLISSLKFSLIQAALSTVLSGILGTLLAFYILESGKGTKSLIWRFGLLSYSIPSLVMVLALLSFWGNEGLNVSLFGWKGILLCHVAMNFPLFMKIIGEGWIATGTEEEMVGLSLGLSRVQLFIFVTVPKIRSSLFSATLLCFTYCFCSFIPVAILGGDPRFATFELNIYQALKFENDLTKASVFAIVQLLVLMPLFIVFRRLSKETLSVSTRSKLKIYAFDGNLNLFARVLVVLPVLFISFGPLGSLLMSAIKNFDKSNAPEYYFALKNSMTVASYCLLIVLPIAFSGAYLERHYSFFAPWVKWFSLLPLFIPIMLLTASLSVSFSFFVEFFRDSYWAVALLQAIVALPLLSRLLANGFLTVSKEIEQSASSLGASASQILTFIELPLLIRFLLLGSGLVICFSLGEVSSLLLFGSSNGPTLSLLIFQKLGKYALNEAYVLAGFLMVLMALIFWGAEKCKPC